VTVIFAGQEIVGGLVSRTVTVKKQLAPPISEEDVTVCVPTVKNEPDAGLFVTAPQLPSTEAAANETKAPGLPPDVVSAVTTTLAGQVSVQVPPAPLATTVAVSAKLFRSLRSFVPVGLAGVKPTMSARLRIVVPAGVPELTS
jgi:hypothetical protein